MLWVQILSLISLAALAVVTFSIIGFIDWLRKLEQERREGRGIPKVFKNPKTGESCNLPSVLHDNPTKVLSIILPAYNEQYRLPQTLDETLNYLAERKNRQGPNFTYEIIVVDDGSTDQTADVTYKYILKHGLDIIRLITYKKNRGKGFAVKIGLMSCRGQYALMADSDGATTLRDLEELEKKLEGTGVGMVFGSRAHLQSDAVAQRTAVRNFLMHGFHLLVMMVVGKKIRDTQCGFKLYERWAIQQIFPNLRLQRWCQDVEIIYVAQQLGISMREVKVNWTEIPGSKIRATSIVHMALEIVGVKVAYSLLGLWRIEKLKQQ
eukprot:TRINITY_DN869_c1_g2_i3.p1 TRINITY_DN869_c1_g2~~TRINITY_DN869_c1_g2_i3.p1  ORF type:complete len:322 (-),score=46.28 TRINITY_DN869_c1_g2_i3:377-1342(-)